MNILKSLWDTLTHHKENGAEEFSLKIIAHNPGCNIEVDLIGSGPRAKPPVRLSVGEDGEVKVIGQPAGTSLAEGIAATQAGANAAVTASPDDDSTNVGSAGGTNVVDPGTAADGSARSNDDAATRQADAEQAPAAAGSGDPVQADSVGPSESDATNAGLNAPIDGGAEVSAK